MGVICLLVGPGLFGNGLIFVFYLFIVCLLNVDNHDFLLVEGVNNYAQIS